MTKTIPEESSPREGYWSSFSIPVGVGLGSSMMAFLMLSSLVISNDTSIALVLLLVSVFHLGHIALWPLLAVVLLRRADRTSNLSARKGAVLSLKCYAIWMVVVVVPAAWVTTTMNGIV